MKLTEWQRRGVRLADWHAHYCRLYGVTPAGYKAWSAEEAAVLTRHYPDYEAAQRALPWRTRKALERKAAKLGIMRASAVWRGDEWSVARPLYRRGESVRECIAPTVGKVPTQVWSKAAKAGVRRPRKPPKDTPWPLVNTIRHEAFRQRLSMTDLDELAGTGWYFRRPSGVRERPIKKAIALLGGRLSIRWADE